MEVLTKQQLLERRRPLAFEDVPAPEFGENGEGAPVQVRVQEMHARAREAWGAFAFEVAEGKKNTARPDFRARLVLHTAVSDAGERLFTDEDLELVATLPGPLVDRLAAAAIRLNRLNEDAGDLTKN